MTPSEPPEGEPPGSRPPTSGPHWERPQQGPTQEPPPPGGWARPPAGPPPGKQRSRACFWGCVGALAFVVAIAVILVVVIVVVNNDTDHPPADDVKVTSCTVNSATQQATARVEIHNHSSKASTYAITVEFVAASGTRVSEGGTLSSTVAPGQTVRTDVGGADRVTQKVTCKVADVTRVAS